MQRITRIGLLLIIVAITTAPTLLAAAPVERLIFASAGFSESNRFWTVARPDLLQFDPYLETLLDIGRSRPRRR